MDDKTLLRLVEKEFSDRGYQSRRFAFFSLASKPQRPLHLLTRGRAYEVVLDPVVQARSIPNQTTGTCYFHACINCVVNRPIFRKAFLAHIASQIKASPCARREGETAEEARDRRFGKKKLLGSRPRTTASQVTDFEDMPELIKKTSADEELHRWARNVILLQLLTSKATVIDGTMWGRSPGSKNMDASAHFALNPWARNVDTKIKAVLKKVEGGEELDAMVRMFRLSGMQVTSSKSSDGAITGLIGRTESGTALACTLTWVADNPDMTDPVEIPPKDIATMTVQDWDEVAPAEPGYGTVGTMALAYKGGFHAVAFTRRPGQTADVIDSNTPWNFRTYSKGQAAVIMASSTYVLQMPDWPFVDQKGGDPEWADLIEDDDVETETDVKDELTAMLDTNEAVLDGKTDVTDMNPDVEEALLDVDDALLVAEAVEADLVSEPAVATGGGYSSETLIAWGTLAGIVLAASLIG